MLSKSCEAKQATLAVAGGKPEINSTKDDDDDDEDDEDGARAPAAAVLRLPEALPAALAPAAAALVPALSPCGAMKAPLMRAAVDKASDKARHDSASSGVVSLGGIARA